jgi:hypothetical protein
VDRAHVDAVDDFQAGGGDPFQQLLARAQAQVLGQVGQDQPAFAARRQVGRPGR